MSFGGFVRRSLYWSTDFLRGSKVRVHFNELKDVFSNYKNGIIIQNNNLNKLLEHATTYSDFYKKYKNKDLNEFPVVDKVFLTSNYDLIKIPDENIPFQETFPVHIQKTSGSTGTPFSIHQDSRKRYRRIAELKYFGETVGFKTHEKLGQCRIWTKWQSKSKFQSFKENIIPINISQMDEETILKIFKIVHEKKIISLRAYASWYDSLVNYLEKNKKYTDYVKTLKVAISSSEALNEETREKMKNLTGCYIVECYADEEAGILAHQKINDTNYYLNHASYKFEILKLDKDESAEYGELGRIVITDLFNYAFPLIRYDTGDTAILEKPNKNSDGYSYISKLFGRRLDLIYNVQGNPVHPMSLARILKNFSGIIQWQFIQNDKDIYTVKLNVEKDYNNFDECISQLKAVLGDEAVINLIYVNEIPVLASGKRKSVICEWENKK